MKADAVAHLCNQKSGSIRRSFVSAEVNVLDNVSANPLNLTNSFVAFRPDCDGDAHRADGLN